jgi:hypothetical protein
VRENRTHGSEGGESREALLYPYSVNMGLSGYQKSSEDNDDIHGVIEVQVVNYFDLEPFTK